MEDTIIALLNNNLRVIIPDFGAFIIRQKQPRIIVFNEFLRYNDGILIDFIVKTEGIDREIAEQRVADFAEDGTRLLASGRELIIEGLGSLRKDSSGKINFIEAPEIIDIEVDEDNEPEKIAVREPEIVPDEGNKAEIPPVTEPGIPEKPESKTPAAKKSKATKAPVKPKPSKKKLPKKLPVDIPLPAIEPAVVEAAIEAAPEVKGIEPAAVEPELTEAPIEKAIEPAAVEPALEAPPVELAIEPAVVESQQALEPSKDEQQEALEPAKTGIQAEAEARIIEAPRANDVVSIKPPRAEEPAPVNDQPAPVSTNRILAWVLIILFVNAGILAWFVFRNKTKETSAGKPVTTIISDTLYDQLADSVRAAAMDTSIVYSENQDEVKDNALAPGSRYYIVAGCFRAEINADSLVSSLKLQGYKAEKFGKIGNLYAVCFASFDNKEKAVSELKKIREKDPSAWMTKF